MISQGLIVRLESRSGKDGEVEEFLRSAVAKVHSEPSTSACFALRFGRSGYGIFDAFPDEAGREAHLGGAVAGCLRICERGHEHIAGLGPQGTTPLLCAGECLQFALKTFDAVAGPLFDRTCRVRGGRVRRMGAEPALNPGGAA